MYCGVTRWIDQCSRVWDQWEGAWDLIWTQQTAIMQPGSVSNYTFPNTQSHTTLERPRRNFQTMIQNKFNLVAENVDDPKLGGWLAGLLAAQYSSLSLHVDTEIFCSNLDPDTTTPHPTLKYNNKGIWQTLAKPSKYEKKRNILNFVQHLRQKTGHLILFCLTCLKIFGEISMLLLLIGKLSRILKERHNILKLILGGGSHSADRISWV